MKSANDLLDGAKQILASKQAAAAGSVGRAVPTFLDLADHLLLSSGYAAVKNARVSAVIQGRRVLLRPAEEAGGSGRLASRLLIEDEASLGSVSELRIALPHGF